jgi:hypothetical protein
MENTMFSVCSLLGMTRVKFSKPPSDIMITDDQIDIHIGSDDFDMRKVSLHKSDLDVHRFYVSFINENGVKEVHRLGTRVR